MQIDDDGDFSPTPYERFTTTAGAVEVPILYRRTAWVMAGFRVDHAPAQAAVRPFGLEAVRLPGAQAFAVLTFASYGESTIGPYGESGLALACVPAGAGAAVPSVMSLWRSRLARQGLGYAVLHLPVTSGLACAAGRDIWGYPEFVTAVEARIDGRHVTGDVRDPGSGASLVHLEGRAGLALPSPALDVLLYSRLGGVTLAAMVEARGMGWLCTPGTVRLAPLAGSHPMAGTLAMLGLDGARPAVVFRAEEMRMRLCRGLPLPAEGAEQPAVAHGEGSPRP